MLFVQPHAACHQLQTLVQNLHCLLGCRKQRNIQLDVMNKQWWHLIPTAWMLHKLVLADNQGALYSTSLQYCWCKATLAQVGRPGRGIGHGIHQCRQSHPLLGLIWPLCSITILPYPITLLWALRWPFPGSSGHWPLYWHQQDGSILPAGATNSCAVTTCFVWVEHVLHGCKTWIKLCH